ncbi:MAG: hypothetical protein AAF639_05640 [Chloroflexota bacterium]
MSQEPTSNPLLDMLKALQTPNQDELLDILRAIHAPAQMLMLVAQNTAEKLDALSESGEAYLAENETSEDAEVIRERLVDLQRMRQHSQDEIEHMAAQLLAVVDEAAETLSDAGEIDAVADLLIAWIQTSDWEASQAFIHEHANTLLTDVGEMTLNMLLEGNQADERAAGQLRLHQYLLQQCRANGIDAAYTQLRNEFD